MWSKQAVDIEIGSLLTTAAAMLFFTSDKRDFPLMHTGRKTQQHFYKRAGQLRLPRCFVFILKKIYTFFRSGYCFAGVR